MAIKSNEADDVFLFCPYGGGEL